MNNDIKDIFTLNAVLIKAFNSTFLSRKTIIKGKRIWVLPSVGGTRKGGGARPPFVRPCIHLNIVLD